MTASILYLSITLHRQNRQAQSTLLRQQSFVIGNIIEPQPLAGPPPNRIVEAGLWETAKDKWNAELERGVRKLYSVDWNDVRESAEESVSALYRRAFEKAKENIPAPPTK